LGLPPAPLWAAISRLALPTCASNGASDQLYFPWDSSKRKSTGSDHPITYKRYYNPVLELRRSSLGLPPAPLWAAISRLALPTCASTGASEKLCFVWDSSVRKSTGSDHPLTYKRYYNPVCALRRSSLVFPPAPLWAAILV